MDRRFYEHQEGLIKGCYTHNKRPVKLVHVEESSDILAAISREKQMKGWSRKKKKALIAGDYEKLVELSRSHPSASLRRELSRTLRVTVYPLEMRKNHSFNNEMRRTVQ